MNNTNTIDYISELIKNSDYIVIYNYLFPILLTISETLPFIKDIKGNGILEVIRNIGRNKNNPENIEKEIVIEEIRENIFKRWCEFPVLYESTIKYLESNRYKITKKTDSVIIEWG